MGNYHEEDMMSAETSATNSKIAEIQARKASGKPLVCLTAYTAYMARALDTHVDILLVGDSLGMVVYGMENTRDVTLEMMVAHGKAVAGNASNALVVIDMPYGSYEESPDVALENARHLLRETGCAAVKLEGGAARAETVRHLVENGVAVMGHIGLLPQGVSSAEGYRIVGKKPEEWEALEADAIALTKAGVFSMVLEGTVEPLARRICEMTSAPVIGIGASPACDGQILVTEDMLGLNATPPRFVKQYAELGETIEAAVKAYAKETRLRCFPSSENVYGGTIEQLPRRSTRSPSPQRKESRVRHG